MRPHPELRGLVRPRWPSSFSAGTRAAGRRGGVASGVWSAWAAFRCLTPLGCGPGHAPGSGWVLKGLPGVAPARRRFCPAEVVVWDTCGSHAPHVTVGGLTRCFSQQLYVRGINMVCCLTPCWFRFPFNMGSPLLPVGRTGRCFVVGERTRGKCSESLSQCCASALPE